MIIVKNNYLCNNVAKKVYRMQIANLLIKLLQLNCKLEDYDIIQKALQDFINKTKYAKELNKTFNLFNFKVVKTTEILKKYGEKWRYSKIFATQKSLFLQYSETNFLAVEFDKETEQEMKISNNLNLLSLIISQYQRVDFLDYIQQMDNEKLNAFLSINNDVRAFVNSVQFFNEMNAILNKLDNIINAEILSRKQTVSGSLNGAKKN